MPFIKSHYQKGVVYSPRWWGTLDFAPEAEVLAYNDAECFLIAKMTQENFDALVAFYHGLPNTPDCQVEEMTEEEAMEELSTLKEVYPDLQGAGITNFEKETRQVWHGDALRLRWSKTVEENAVEVKLAIDAQLEDIFQQLGWGDTLPVTPINPPRTFRIWCEKCGYSSKYNNPFPAGIKAASFNLNITCRAGHKFTVKINPETGEVLSIEVANG